MSEKLTKKQVIEERRRKREEALAAAKKQQQKKAVLITVSCVAAVLVVAVLALLVMQPWAGRTGGSNGETSLAAGTDASGGGGASDTSKQGDKTEAEKRHIEITVKDYGVIKAELDPTYAPETVENFVSLAESGFYDGLTFHRIMEGFMIQGGDPSHNGTGGSGKNIKGEFSANGVNNPTSHKRGVISMARSSSYDSASSQFFIVQEDSPHLDGQYAAFGFVTEGMDIVDKIAADAEPVDDNGTVLFENQPVIEKITVVD